MNIFIFSTYFNSLFGGSKNFCSKFDDTHSAIYFFGRFEVGVNVKVPLLLFLVTSLSLVSCTSFLRHGFDLSNFSYSPRTYGSHFLFFLTLLKPAVVYSVAIFPRSGLPDHSFF